MKTILLSLLLTTAAAFAQQPLKVITLSANATNDVVTNTLVLKEGEAVRVLGGSPAWNNGYAVPTYRQAAFEKSGATGQLLRGDVIVGPATILVSNADPYGRISSAFVTLERWRVLKSK